MALALRPVTQMLDFDKFCALSSNSSRRCAGCHTAYDFVRHDLCPWASKKKLLSGRSGTEAKDKLNNTTKRALARMFIYHPVSTQFLSCCKQLYRNGQSNGNMMTDAGRFAHAFA